LSAQPQPCRGITPLRFCDGVLSACVRHAELLRGAAWALSSSPLCERRPCGRRPIADVPHSSPDERGPGSMRRFGPRASICSSLHVSGEATAASGVWQHGSRTPRSSWSLAWPMPAAPGGGRRRGVPSRGQSRSPVSWTSPRACPRECDGSPHERTGPLVCSAHVRLASLFVNGQPFPSRAWPDPPMAFPMQRRYLALRS
jgi:hypothetical protein